MSGRKRKDREDEESSSSDNDSENSNESYLGENYREDISGSRTKKQSSGSRTKKQRTSEVSEEVSEILGSTFSLLSWLREGESNERRESISSVNGSDLANQAIFTRRLNQEEAAQNTQRVLEAEKSFLEKYFESYRNFIENRNSNTVEDRIARLQALGHEVENVPGDGDCFFHAVALNLGILLNQQDIRNGVAGYVRKNPNDAGGFLYNNDAEAYANRIANPGFWGGEEDAYFVANAYKRVVVIFNGANHQVYYPQDYNPLPNDEVIGLFFDGINTGSGGAHYRAVLNIHVRDLNQLESADLLNALRDVPEGATIDLNNEPAEARTSSVNVNKEEIKQQQQEIIQKNHFKIVDVEGDGNCLPRAIATILNWINKEKVDDSNYLHLRNEAAEYIKHNPIYISRYLEISRDIVRRIKDYKKIENKEDLAREIAEINNSLSDNISLEALVNKFRTDKEWLGHEFVQAIANIYGLDFYIIDDNRLGVAKVLSDTTNKAHPVLMKHVNNNHFQACIPDNNPSVPVPNPRGRYSTDSDIITTKENFEKELEKFKKEWLEKHEGSSKEIIELPNDISEFLEFKEEADRHRAEMNRLDNAPFGELFLEFLSEMAGVLGIKWL